MYGTLVHDLVRIADMRQVRLGDLYYTGEPIASGYYKGTQKGETGLYHTDMCSQMYMHTHIVTGICLAGQKCQVHSR